MFVRITGHINVKVVCENRINNYIRSSYLVNWAWMMSVVLNQQFMKRSLIIIILEDLYYGRLQPNELIKPSDPESQRINQRITDAMQMLKESLSAIDFDQVEKLFDLQSDSSSLHSALSFIQGYKIGALMMIDVFSGEKDSIYEGM